MAGLKRDADFSARENIKMDDCFQVIPALSLKIIKCTDDYEFWQLKLTVVPILHIAVADIQTLMKLYTDPPSILV